MNRRRIVGALLGIGVLVGLIAAPSAKAEAPEPSEQPTRVIILVLDQARPDTITRYKMHNVQALIEAGAYQKLQDYLDDKFGETSKFVSLAQKRTAVCTAGNTSSAAGDGT